MGNKQKDMCNTIAVSIDKKKKGNNTLVFFFSNHSNLQAGSIPQEGKASKMSREIDDSTIFDMRSEGALPKTVTSRKVSNCL